MLGGEVSAISVRPGRSWSQPCYDTPPSSQDTQEWPVKATYTSTPEGIAKPFDERATESYTQAKGTKGQTTNKCSFPLARYHTHHPQPRSTSPMRPVRRTSCSLAPSSSAPFDMSCSAQRAPFVPPPHHEIASHRSFCSRLRN